LPVRSLEASKSEVLRLDSARKNDCLDATPTPNEEPPPGYCQLEPGPGRLG
jgi:hypothetical protein